jgi:hypothetical protein
VNNPACEDVKAASSNPLLKESYMTREPRLTAARRRRIRQLLLAELSWAPAGYAISDFIDWTYRDMPKHREYANAAMWALETGEPFDIHAGQGT